MALKNMFEEYIADTNGFTEMARFLKSHTGIHLIPSDKNKSLLAARTQPILEQLNYCSYHDFLVNFLVGNNELTELFIQTMTTNKTEFYRERIQFVEYTEILKKDLENKLKNFQFEYRIWCSAASTGEEPYSILFHTLDSLEKESIQLKILASDIDLKVLENASIGCYSVNQLNSISPIQQKKYFVPTKLTEKFQVHSKYRNMIRFAQFNLSQPNFQFKYKFDIIFCRNVLIYFDTETIDRVIKNFTKVLAPGGHLFVGLSETAFSCPKNLVSIGSGIYRLIANDGK